MFRRSVQIVLAVLVVSSMLLVACQPAPTTEAPAQPAPATEAPAVPATEALVAPAAPAATEAPVSPATEAPVVEKATTAEKDTLVYAAASDVRSLDPSLASGRLDVSVLYSIFDLLAIRDETASRSRTLLNPGRASMILLGKLKFAKVLHSQTENP